MGVPPFLSFFSEVLVLSSVGRRRLYGFGVIGVVLFCRGCYSIFLYVVCFHGGRKGGTASGLIRKREFLVFYFHFFYMLFCVVFVGSFI